MWIFELALPGKPLEALAETSMNGMLGWASTAHSARTRFSEAFCRSSKLRTATDGHSLQGKPWDWQREEDLNSNFSLLLLLSQKNQKKNTTNNNNNKKKKKKKI